MAVVTVRRDRIRVSPSLFNPKVKVLRVPDEVLEDTARTIVFLLTQDFIDAYRRGAA